MRNFYFSVNQKNLDSKSKVPIRLSRAVIFSPIGEISAQSAEFLISLDVASGLHKLSQKPYSVDHDEAKKTKDTCRKFFDNNEKFLALGLKNLLREEAGMIKFCTHYSVY
jgi:hypothetical protein